jgi:glycosyltransferase involved in cell wall biosynthesis
MASSVPFRPLTILYHHRTRSRDGQSVHIDELIQALRDQGHKVVVVEPQRVPATQASLKKKLLPKLLYEILELCYSFLEFIKLARASRQYRPDALYQRANIFMLSGVWTARWFRIPYLLEVNAPLALERGKFDGLSLPWLAAWTEHSMWRSADYVLPVTHVLARHVEKAGVTRDHIVVAPNGIDLERLKPTGSIAEAKKSLNLGAELVLGFVGFVRDWHGLDHIVDLLAQEPDLEKVRLLIVGDGPACEELREQAKRLNIAKRVTITGVIPHERLAQYVSAMDIALQPHVTPYASPLKLFEYMALGRAIIAPDTENIREILEPEVDSLLFTAGDQKTLSAAIRRLAGDGELRLRLGNAAAAKILARNLTWRGNAERVAKLIEHLQSQAPKKSR